MNSVFPETRALLCEALRWSKTRLCPKQQNARKCPGASHSTLRSPFSGSMCLGRVCLSTSAHTCDPSESSGTHRADLADRILHFTFMQDHRYESWISENAELANSTHEQNEFHNTWASDLYCSQTYYSTRRCRNSQNYGVVSLGKLCILVPSTCPLRCKDPLSSCTKLLPAISCVMLRMIRCA